MPVSSSSLKERDTFLVFQVRLECQALIIVLNFEVLGHETDLWPGGNLCLFVVLACILLHDNLLVEQDLHRTIHLRLDARIKSKFTDQVVVV